MRISDEHKTQIKNKEEQEVQRRKSALLDVLKMSEKVKSASLLHYRGQTLGPGRSFPLKEKTRWDSDVYR
jgi:hypothetical protein